MPWKIMVSQLSLTYYFDKYGIVSLKSQILHVFLGYNPWRCNNILLKTYRYAYASDSMHTPAAARYAYRRRSTEKSIIITMVHNKLPGAILV